MADPTQVSKALRAARELLAAGWCQEAIARTDTGVAVYDENKAATAFCLWGACCRAVSDMGLNYQKDLRLMDAIAFALDETVGVCAVDWNDTPGRTQLEVLAVVDAIIARLESQ